MMKFKRSVILAITAMFASCSFYFNQMQLALSTATLLRFIRLKPEVCIHVLAM